MTTAITVTGLSYTYPDGKEALHEVTFQVEAGECVGLVGPNGSGKSTLLMHFNGILPETLGPTPNISVFGLPITEIHLPEIRRRVGLLFQDPDDQLFCPTVFEDVAFGPEQFGLPPETLHGTVKKALKSAGLEGFERRSPQHLSGGEKRRVCLAGVLACRPDILVLDEPTSDLDPRGKKILIELLRSIPATKIIATHDLELIVTLCPRTILLDEGRVVADGGTVELFSNEDLMVSHGLEKPHILRHSHPH